MKKLILAACFVIGATAMSFAQGGGGAGGGGGQGGGRGFGMPPADQAKQLQTQLKLTDDQTTKVTAILTKQAAKMDSIRKAPGFDPSTMRTMFAPMQAANTAQIKAVLTADQATEYDKVLAARRGGGGRGGAGGGGGGTPPPPPPPAK